MKQNIETTARVTYDDETLDVSGIEIFFKGDWRWINYNPFCVEEPSHETTSSTKIDMT